MLQSDMQEVRGYVPNKSAAFKASSVLLLVVAALGALLVGFAFPPYAGLIIGGLVGVCLVLICLVRPAIGLCLFAALLYARVPDVATTLTGLQSSGVAFGILLITALVTSQGIVSLRRIWSVPWWPLIIYSAALLLSVNVAINQERSLDLIATHTREMLYVVVIALLARQVSDLRLLFWGMVIAGTLLASITIYQAVSGSRFEFYGFGRYSDQIVVPGELETQARPTGSLADPNFYALALVSLMPLAVHRYRHERRAIWRGLALLSTGVLAVAAILTYSRGGLVALAVVFATLTFGKMLRVRHLLIGGVVAMLIFAMLPSAYTQRFSTLTELVTSRLGGEEAQSNSQENIQGRVIEMLAGVHMFLDHPILGVGIDNYQDRFQEYARPLGFDGRGRRSPHSLPVQIVAETGVVGLGSFAMLFIALFRWLWRDWRQTKPQPEISDFAVACMAALSTNLIGSIFLHLAYSRFLWMLVATGLAVHVIARQAVQTGWTSPTSIVATTARSSVSYEAAPTHSSS